MLQLIMEEGRKEKLSSIRNTSRYFKIPLHIGIAGSWFSRYILRDSGVIWWTSITLIINGINTSVGLPYHHLIIKNTKIMLNIVYEWFTESKTELLMYLNSGRGLVCEPPVREIGLFTVSSSTRRLFWCLSFRPETREKTLNFSLSLFFSTSSRSPHLESHHLTFLYKLQPRIFLPKK